MKLSLVDKLFKKKQWKQVNAKIVKKDIKF
jgi:hypothetical protein